MLAGANSDRSDKEKLPLVVGQNKRLHLLVSAEAALRAGEQYGIQSAFFVLFGAAAIA